MNYYAKIYWITEYIEGSVVHCKLCYTEEEYIEWVRRNAVHVYIIREDSGYGQ